MTKILNLFRLNINNVYICQKLLGMILNNKIELVFLLLFGTVLYGQRAVIKNDTVRTQNLDEVIVSATRTLRQLSSLPLPVQLISNTEIRQINSLRLHNVLNEQTGLITVPDFGGGEGIQLQGLDSQYTLLLIDGVPLIGRSAGTLDLSRITVGNIKQIEIVKGASSSLYGSEAMGGVINIITEKATDGFQGSLRNRYGSFNGNDLGVNLSYKKDKVSFSTYLNSYNSDGYDLDTSTKLNTVEPFRNYTISTKVLYDFSEMANVFVSGRYYTQKQEYVASETLKGESEIREWNTHLKLEQQYNAKWNSYFEFYATRYKADEHLNNPDNSLFSVSNFNQLLLKPEIRGSYAPSKKSTFVGGIGLSHETLERTDFSTNPIFNSPYIYVQYDTNPTEKINVLVGTRFDAHNNYASQFSPKGALRYQINSTLAVKGSIGYGFKAPDFRQLYFDFSNATVGYTVLGYNAVPARIPELENEGQIANIVVPISAFNAELSPENSIGINVGADYKPLNTVSLSINLFRNNIKDLIDTRVIANKTNGQNIFSYYNVNEVYTKGLEFNATWKPTTQLKIATGYQLLYAKDKKAKNAFSNGEVYARESSSSSSFQLKEAAYFGLYNRSRHMANFKVFYNIPKWSVNTNLRGVYRSKYGIYDTNGNNFLDTYDDFISGYSIWNWAINKTFYKNYQLGFGVDNFMGFTDTQNISNIAGRIVYGKLNIQF